MTALLARAFGFASTLSPKDTASTLGVDVVRQTKTLVVMKTKTGEFVVGYDFGALVFFGVAASEERRMLDLLLAKVAPEPHPPMEESLSLELVPGAAMSVTFDGVKVPELSVEVVQVVALALAQSVAMEYYEEDVDLLMVRLRTITEAFAQTGKFKGHRRELMKFIGSGMVTRNQVVFTLALLDTPALVWSVESLDALYRGLRAQFEIEDRYRALDHKLTMLQDTFALLADLTQQRRSWVLEVAVAVGVAIEVVLFLYQIYKG